MCGCAATVPQAHELNPTGGVAPEARPARPLILVNVHPHRYPKRAPSEAHMKALIRLIIAVYIIAAIAIFAYNVTENASQPVMAHFIQALLWPIFIFMG